MIANNENGRATEVTPPIVIANAGRGAVNHVPQSNQTFRPLGVSPPEALICECNSLAWPCEDCKKENAEKATLSRLRLLRESDGGATDGEPRDGDEGYSNDN